MELWQQLSRDWFNGKIKELWEACNDGKIESSRVTTRLTN